MKARKAMKHAQHVKAMTAMKKMKAAKSWLAVKTKQANKLATQLKKILKQLNPQGQFDVSEQLWLLLHNSNGISQSMAK